MGRHELIATGQVSIKARPEEVFRVISDPVAMVSFGEETTKVRWLRGVQRPALGARFRGFNRNGWRRWFVTCRVTDFDPPNRFAFAVRTPFFVPISRWVYEITPDGTEGCVLTESAYLRAPSFFVPMAIAITGEPDRPGVNSRNIAITLGRLRDHFEGRRPPVAA